MARAGAQPSTSCRNGDCFLFSSRVKLMGGSTAGLRGIYGSAEPSDAGVATGDRGWRMPPTGMGLRCRNR